MFCLVRLHEFAARVRLDSTSAVRGVRIKCIVNYASGGAPLRIGKWGIPAFPLVRIVVGLSLRCT